MYLSLQAGRAVAAILVLLFHLGATIALPKYFDIPFFAQPFSFGDSGVEFFFILSGFIIYYVHHQDLGQPKSVHSYFLKRIVRIYPTYIIVFSAVWLLAMVMPGLQNTVPHDFKSLLSSILLIPQDKELVGGTGAKVLIVAWTLQYEMMFYFFFAIAIINKTVGKLLLFIFVLASLTGLSHYAFPYTFIFSTYVWLFLMGMGIGHVFLNNWHAHMNLKFLLYFGVFVYLVLALDQIFIVNVFKESTQTILYGLSCSLIVLSLISLEHNKQLVVSNQKLVKLLGNSSYALYLIHFPLISVICKLAMMVGLGNLGVFGALVTYLISFIVCIVVSIVFYQLIESPLMVYFKGKLKL